MEIIDWLVQNNREYAQYTVIDVTNDFTDMSFDKNYCDFLMQKRNSGVKYVIDVLGDIDLGFKGLTEIPFHFGRINHHAHFAMMPAVTSGGIFNIEDNQIQDLSGSPYLAYDFICSRNKVKTFENGPQVISGKIDCAYNQLKNFKGFPTKLDKIICYDNQLETLLFLPQFNYIYMQVLLTSFYIGGTTSKLLTSGKKLLKYKEYNKMDISEHDFFMHEGYEYWRRFHEQEKIMTETNIILDKIEFEDDSVKKIVKI